MTEEERLYNEQIYILMLKYSRRKAMNIVQLREENPKISFSYLDFISRKLNGKPLVDVLVENDILEKSSEGTTDKHSDAIGEDLFI